MSVTADVISDILADVARKNKQIQMNVNAEVSRAKKLAEKALKNAKGSPGSMQYSKTGSNSHFVSSGTNANGEPYYIDQENVVIGNRLHRTERVYNATTKRIDEHRYTFDLDDPDASPVLSDEDYSSDED